MLDVAPKGSQAADPGAETAVSVRSVTHRHGATLALDDLSLDIPSGRMVGVIVGLPNELAPPPPAGVAPALLPIDW